MTAVRGLCETVAAALLPAALLVLCAAPAAADPVIPQAPPGGGMTIDGSRWPAALDRFVVGSPAYEATYGTKNPDPIAGQCDNAGGDLWRYTSDFFDNLGAILAATSEATGKPWLPLLDSDKPVATTPWDAAAFSASDLTVPVASDGGAPVYASPGKTLGFDHAANPAGPCTNDFAPYTAPDASSALGFAFFPAPDDASIAFMKARVAAQPTPLETAGGMTQATPAQYWDAASGADNPLRSWDYDPLDVKNYCTDSADPFCATATFLHCPQAVPADPVAAQNVTNCYTFNANVMLLNQKLALWLYRQGTPPGKGIRIATAIDRAGAQAPLDQWFAIASMGKTYTGRLKTVLGVMAGSAVAGGLLAGGVTGGLLAAGVVAVAASPALDKIWGAVQCGTDFFKCLAKGGVDALNTSMGMVMQAAATSQPVSLMDFSGLFNRLAGISGAVVIIIFLLTLATTALTGRTGKILPAGIGLVQWAVTIALGTTVVAALGGLAGTIADVIGGTGSTDAITNLARSVSQAGTDLPNSVSGGWLLAFIFAVIATIAGAVIWLVLTVAPSFIPLAAGLMILQASGLSSAGWGRKWLARGFGILWAIVLLRPTIALVARISGHVSLTGGMGGIIAGSLMLAVAAIAPWWIGKQFPLAREDGFGLGGAVLGGMAVASRFRPRGHGGPSGRPGGSRSKIAASAAGPSAGGDPANPTGPTGPGDGGPAGSTGPVGGGPAGSTGGTGSPGSAGLTGGGSLWSAHPPVGPSVATPVEPGGGAAGDRAGNSSPSSAPAFPTGGGDSASNPYDPGGRGSAPGPAGGGPARSSPAGPGRWGAAPAAPSHGPSTQLAATPGDRTTPPDPADSATSGRGVQLPYRPADPSTRTPTGSGGGAGGGSSAFAATSPTGDGNPAGGDGAAALRDASTGTAAYVPTAAAASDDAARAGSDKARADSFALAYAGGPDGSAASTPRRPTPPAAVAAGSRPRTGEVL